MRKAPGDPTKRPIPATWRGWRKECDGIRRFLAETAHVPRTPDTAWIHGHRRYYKARLAYLRQHEPAK